MKKREGVRERTQKLIQIGVINKKMLKNERNSRKWTAVTKKAKLNREMESKIMIIEKVLVVLVIQIIRKNEEITSK